MCSKHKSLFSSIFSTFFNIKNLYKNNNYKLKEIEFIHSLRLIIIMYILINNIN